MKVGWLPQIDLGYRPDSSTLVKRKTRRQFLDLTLVINPAFVRQLPALALSSPKQTMVNMLMDVYALNRGKSRIYSELEYLDWYDGYMSGIFKLDQTDKWFAFAIVYYDVKETWDRFFYVIEPAADWSLAFVEIIRQEPDNVDYSLAISKLREVFNQHQGPVYLLKCGHFDEVDYTIVEIPLAHLNYVSEEKACSQSKRTIAKLKSFFK